ncbi:hypothetical protein C7M84_004101 [Penaeus vannamei]|uniref:Uncharacterized protein n=1 Tax=Penaeus vannamei TaxID=6689 RepID=A0A423TL99_PENVA|nr:hypothetical protein C7M84_004101 [Penaeus vannamei]
MDPTVKRNLFSFLFASFPDLVPAFRPFEDSVIATARRKNQLRFPRDCLEEQTDPKACNEEVSVDESKQTAQPLNNNDGEHKTSWAKMALASKDYMERLAAELKEKEEQEKIKKMRLNTRPQTKPQEKVLVPRERDGKPLRRDGPPRENRLSGEMGSAKFRPRDSARPKSPK